MTTKDKILETAQTLFNQDGATDVTTNLIASTLGMSPGNLYYHYRNKEEIIRALFHAFDTAADQLFKLSEDRLPTLIDLEQMLEGIYELQWQYRFFFRDQMTLLRRDPELETTYRTHRARGFEGTRQLIRVFSSVGVIAPITNEKELDTLTRLIWMVTDFWLPSLELGGEPVNPEQFKKGVTLLQYLIQLHAASI
jgi:AcrR family transcriptional regulator